MEKPFLDHGFCILRNGRAYRKKNWRITNLVLPIRTVLGILNESTIDKKEMQFFLKRHFSRDVLE